MHSSEIIAPPVGIQLSGFTAPNRERCVELIKAPSFVLPGRQSIFLDTLDDDGGPYVGCLQGGFHASKNPAWYFMDNELYLATLNKPCCRPGTFVEFLEYQGLGFDCPESFAIVDNDESGRIVACSQKSFRMDWWVGQWDVKYQLFIVKEAM